MQLSTLLSKHLTDAANIQESNRTLFVAGLPSKIRTFQIVARKLK
jgi:hypothetical protein